ncbi:MAG: Gfo/Idh/MocA family oxidoreductase [Rhodothermales bacterium]
MKTIFLLFVLAGFVAGVYAQSGASFVRVGMIGLDTSHSTAFTKVLNDEAAEPDVAGFRVVAAYPKGSPDIESSVSRVPGYTEEMRAMGVEIVDSIERLLTMVDVVLLETNDGRPHYEQVLPVLKAGKPVFIDKPVAGTLADAIRIFDAAKQYGVPVFSSSSLRYSANAQAVRNGSVGKVLGAEAYSPATLEPTHPDLFWYGIHGVETLFTAMGVGCERVVRVSTRDTDVVVGTWADGRIGTFRGLRAGHKNYGGTAFGETGIQELGPYDGYRPLVVEIVRFFRTGAAPVTAEETLEIYTFMEAADESKRRGGVPVTMAEVYDRAKAEARR